MRLLLHTVPLVLLAFLLLNLVPHTLSDEPDLCFADTDCDGLDGSADAVWVAVDGSTSGDGSKTNPYALTLLFSRITFCFSFVCDTITIGKQLCFVNVAHESRAG